VALDIRKIRVGHRVAVCFRVDEVQENRISVDASTPEVKQSLIVTAAALESALRSRSHRVID
jgi:hypothetical protein